MVLYNFLLGFLASLAYATVTGMGLWEIVQFWVGPLLFFSSFCLAASLFLGSIFAVICTAVVELAQNFPGHFISHMSGFSLQILSLSPTSPFLLLGALCLILCAVFFVPRQSRLAG